MMEEEGREERQLQAVSEGDSNSEVLSVEGVHPSLDISDILRTTPTGQEDITPTLTPTLSPQPPTLPVAQHRSPPLEPSVTVINSGPSDREGEGQGEGEAVSYGVGLEAAEQAIPELPYSEEVRESRDFRLVSVGGEEIRIDLRQLQPYRKIVQHAGGYAREHCVVHLLFHARCLRVQVTLTRAQRQWWWCTRGTCPQGACPTTTRSSHSSSSKFCCL